MVRCKGCGAIISIRDRTCPECGFERRRPKGKGSKTAWAILIVTIVLLASIAYFVFIYDEVGDFGTDYWFETTGDGKEVLVTADGWNFDLNIRQNYSLEGIVLGEKYYYKHDSPYSPVNTFSPIDIFVGIDDVANNSGNYDYHVTSWGDRKVNWYLYYDDYADYEYFRSHTGNNHLIPHSRSVFDKLLELETGDRFMLSGYIVEPYGTRDNHWVTWPSDNQIGNYDCEVILVETLLIF
jgi:hypothetical protein